MAMTEGHTGTTLGRTLGLVPEPARRAVARAGGAAGGRLPLLRRRLSPLGAVTGLGWSVLAGSAAAWIVGGRFGWFELCLAAVIGLLCFLVCWASVAGRTALRVAIGLESGWVRAGESAEPTVQVTNLARRGMLPVALEVAVGPAGRKQPQSIPVPNLGRNATARATRFTVPTERRGVIEIGPATIVRADPLGLIRRTAGWPEVRELIVRPRTVRLPSLSTGLMHDLEGRTSDKVSVSDLEFHTLRDYVRGDDRRHIHWRSSARVGSISGVDKFVVRQFQQTRRTHLLVVVDGDAAAYPDPADFETAVSAGASMTVAAMLEGLESTLLVADRTAQEETPAAHLDACARAEFGRGGSLAALSARGFKAAPHTTVAVLVTGAGIPFADLRRARAQLRPEVLTQVLRVDPARRTGMLPDETMTVLSLRTLDDLPALVGAGGAR
jgi:uncharacterized protein (DUF58 family)